jgi:hypothetical protein
LTQYYYLVASLPMLFFDDPPPLASQAWLDLCREQVSPHDHSLLSRVGFDALDPRPGDPDVWQAYSAWETALRNELILLRAQRLGLDPEPHLRRAPFYPGLGAFAREALDAGTPKAVETALDYRRWSRLDELESGTRFDLGKLVVYRLKLLLLERKARIRPEAGARMFAERYRQVLGDADSRAAAANHPAGMEKAHD